ncbi:MAG: response regulator [Candidatus Omnitrophica bacterium]|nr:response regulator [Candidatus Omnitrophota bacterium]
MTSERLMIVDDDQKFLGEFGEILSMMGYELVQVSDATSVVENAKMFKPHLILLDLKMAKMNGFDVAEKLKTTPETANISIIAISGYYPIEKSNVLIDKTHFDACLTKPFSISDAVSQIEMLLTERQLMTMEL